jgi:hydrogenase expression/formation protein HypE
MNESVTINHGSGGKQSQKLIKDVFVSRFGIEEPLTDSAIIGFMDAGGPGLAFTTDSYVVDPLFFPGGNIGKLAVCGTINDLAVAGADPGYIAVSFIIEEGFPLADLERIVESMADEALNAGVRIVTGDTKVVGKGKCDKLFITTTGTGFLRPGREHISKGGKVREGDMLIINGPLGNHSVAVLGARNNLSFSSTVLSDCRSLKGLIAEILDECSEIHFMRDLTRGGLSAVLNELKEIIKKGIVINEEAVPVDESVKGLCEVLGFDPFSLANEGKVLVVAGKEESQKVLDLMQSHPAGTGSSVIGEINSENPDHVLLNTIAGGRRIIEMPEGLQLPRIC